MVNRRVEWREAGLALDQTGPCLVLKKPLNRSIDLLSCD